MRYPKLPQSAARIAIFASVAWSCSIYNEDLLESSSGGNNDGGGGGGSTGQMMTGGMQMTGGMPTTGMTTGSMTTGSMTTTTTTTTTNTTATTGTGGGPPAVVWINEIHYDDAAGDKNEGLEVAGTAGADLSGFSLHLYSQGALYDSFTLSGTIPNQQAQKGTAWFPRPGIQNGPSDGVALVGPAGVVELLSYEGSFTATDGPAMGVASIDILVNELGTEVGQSLQKIGTGSSGTAFSFAGPSPASPGDINPGQTFN